MNPQYPSPFFLSQVRLVGTSQSSKAKKLRINRLVQVPQEFITFAFSPFNSPKEKGNQHSIATLQARIKSRSCNLQTFARSGIYKYRSQVRILLKCLAINLKASKEKKILYIHVSYIITQIKCQYIIQKKKRHTYPKCHPGS